MAEPRTHARKETSSRTGATLEAPVLGGATGSGSGSGQKTKLADAVFAARFHESLVHQSVRAEQAARRRGTAATKTRGLVAGGGAKPWRQKGTGRARAGSSRSPIWTGGGTVFGPKPRSYTFKVNRKEQRAALRSALSLHAARGSLAVLDTDAFSEPKTRQAAELLDDWRAPEQALPALVVLAPDESAAALSFRNLARVTVLAHVDVGVADLVRAASLLVSRSALDALAVRAGGNGESPAAGDTVATGAKAGAGGSKAGATSSKAGTGTAKAEAKDAKAETGAAKAEAKGAKAETGAAKAEAKDAKAETGAAKAEAKGAKADPKGAKAGAKAKKGSAQGAKAGADATDEAAAREMSGGDSATTDADTGETESGAE